MGSVYVVKGVYASGVFVPQDALPPVDGNAELRVFAEDEHERESSGKHSAFEVFGKAPTLRTREDIDAQIREERESWGDR